MSNENDGCEAATHVVMCPICSHELFRFDMDIAQIEPDIEKYDPTDPKLAVHSLRLLEANTLHLKPWTCPKCSYFSEDGPTYTRIDEGEHDVA